MPVRPVAVYAAALAAAAWFLIATSGCALDGDSRKDGIRFDDPEVGAREVYVRYRYGGLKSPEAVKTYLRDSLVLEVVAVDGRTIRLSEKECPESDSLCHVQELSLDRATGKVSAEGMNILLAVNAFPDGLFTDDSTRQIAFEGYFPVAEEPAVGFAPALATGRRTYRNATVFVDPTGRPLDVGGQCLILSEDMRLVETYWYDVFGIDGGWEARD